MNFKAKLSKQGNSYCIYVPKDVRTNLDLKKEYEWSVRTNVITEDSPQIPLKIENTENTGTTQRSWELCKKHTTSKFKCGCK